MRSALITSLGTRWGDFGRAARKVSIPWASRQSKVSSGLLSSLLLSGVICLLAILLGLATSTGNALLISLISAMVFGPLLLARPVWMMWLVLVIGLLVTGLLPIWAEGAATRSGWAISGLSFLLAVLAIGKVMSSRPLARETPTFVWLFALFVVYAVLVGIAQAPNQYQVFSGIKRYFQAYGVLFALAWLAVRDRDVKWWRQFLMLVALLQLPWALYQRIVLVPVREGLTLAYPGLIPIDGVAGTFGTSLNAGGASGDMALFLIMTAVFVIARWQARLLPAGRALLLLLLVLVPLFLGETKIVLVLLPLAALVHFRRMVWRRPFMAVAMLVVSVLMTAVATIVYLEFGRTSAEAQYREVMDYNFGEMGYGGYRLNRTTVLSFWAQQQSLADPVGAILGQGIGGAYDPTGGEMTRKFPGFGIGLTSASQMLWEQGVLGSLLLLAAFVAAWRCAGRLYSQPLLAWARADAAAIQTCLLLAGVFYFYSGTPTSLLTHQLVVAAMLGYLAWLFKKRQVLRAR